MIEFGYTPPWWGLAAGGGLVLLLVWWSYQTSVGRPGRWTRFTLVLLRLTALGLAFLCWLNPQWVDRVEQQPPLRVAVLLDTSRSMSLHDADPDGRLAEAQEWLGQHLLPLAPRHVQILPYAFDASLRPLTNTASFQAQVFSGLAATGSATAISVALETLWNTTASAPPAAVILCTDGGETEKGDFLSLSRWFRRKGIPIHTICVGTTNEMRDIVVENVQVRRPVGSNAPARIVATLSSPGFAGFSRRVQIRQLQRVLAEQTVLLSGGRQHVEFEFRPPSRQYEIYNVFVPPEPGEWLPSNNRRAFGLEATDATLRVLYMEGTPMQDNAPQPEWRYLKTALESDPHIKVKVLYRTRFRGFQGGFIPEADIQPGDEIYPVEHLTKGYPRTLEELQLFDVVIHSDIPKDMFSQEQLDYTVKWVEEHGGGFVMIGGKSAFGTGGYHRTPLDRLIPVAMESSNDTLNQPFRMALPQPAWNHPLIALGATREETTAMWTTRLPLLYGLNRVNRAKPGATVLAVHPTERNADGPLVVLAVQEIGKGRTMAFTSDITRSWGKDFETLWGELLNPQGFWTEYNCDQRYYRRFWINAVRWLAANRLGRTNNPVVVELPPAPLHPGATLEPLVHVRDATGRPAAAAEVRLALSAPGTVERLAQAEYDPALQAFRARLPMPVAGDFTLRAEASLRGIKLGEDKQLVVVEELDKEMLDVRARPESLATLARLTHGRALDTQTTQYKDLRPLFGSAPPPTVELRRKPMWDNAWLLAAIIGLLTAEWILRRLRGLA
ncbi:MAG: glutamine amidotransferase [Verrucomicrobiae bacterium]|nr:glutamine amidotransferase [Verrucomicrobiae bacterium]